MKHISDYIQTQDIETQVDEGIIKDGVKAVWSWIKKQFKKKDKKTNKYRSYSYYSSDDIDFDEFIKGGKKAKIGIPDSNVSIQQAAINDVQNLINKNAELTSIKKHLEYADKTFGKDEMQECDLKILLLTENKIPHAILIYTDKFNEIESFNEYRAIENADKAALIVAFDYDNKIKTTNQSSWQLLFMTLCQITSKEYIIATANIPADGNIKIPFQRCKFNREFVNPKEKTGHYYINNLKKLQNLLNDY